MPKLDKRQIVVLTLAGLALLWGGYETMFAKPDARTSSSVSATSAVDVQAVVSEITASIAAIATSPLDAHILARTAQEWTRDPFVERKTLQTAKPAGDGFPGKVPETRPVAFSYDGYILQGEKRIAIINGVEYGVGETLEIRGHVLASVTPAKAVIKRTSDGTTIDVPFEE